jgi:hypothetical protein
MRVKITLDEDVYNFAAAYAAARSQSLSAAIGDLLRRAEQVPEVTSMRLKMSQHGYLIISGTGDTLNEAMVKTASEDRRVSR